MFCCHFSLRNLCFVGLCALLILVTTVLYPPSAALTATSREEVSLPIIMYHSLLPHERTSYIVSPKRFESDLKFLSKNGYTTVTMQDVIDYVNGKAPLPSKPIMITFDDGYYNNYTYAYPLLKKYDCKIVLSPIGSCSDRFSENDGGHNTYSHITWQQLREMQASGHVEIANHTYALHQQTDMGRGIQQHRHESDDDYRERLLDDVGGMQERFFAGIGNMPTTFTYPFGAYNQCALNILKEIGFKATLTCEAFTNRITKDPDCLYQLGRYLRPSGIPSEKYFTDTLGFT